MELGGKPEKIPIEEIKKLAAKAMEDNMGIMKALADYDKRDSESLMPVITIRTINFVLSASSVLVTSTLAGQENRPNSQTDSRISMEHIHAESRTTARNFEKRNVNVLPTAT